MSVQAITWALAQEFTITSVHGKERPAAAGLKFVLVALANYADGEGVCFPGQARLSEDTSQGERTVRRHLADLEGRGLITRAHRQRQDGSRTSDEYTLNIQPAKLASRATIQPAKKDNPTGQFGRAILEPSEEPLVKNPPMVPPAVKTGNSHGTRLNPNWNPTTQHLVLGSELGFNDDWVRAESEKFRDYWTAESGQRARKRDWDAAFRVWLRKSAEYAGRSQSPNGQRQAGTGGRGDTGLAAALRTLKDRREAV